MEDRGPRSPSNTEAVQGAWWGLGKRLDVVLTAPLGLMWTRVDGDRESLESGQVAWPKPAFSSRVPTGPGKSLVSESQFSQVHGDRVPLATSQTADGVEHVFD